MKKHLLLILAALIAIPGISFCQYYQDLNSNVSWHTNVNLRTLSLSGLEKGFNNGREKENQQLGSNLPQIDFPDKETWNNWTFRSKVVWVINEERKARGLLPFKGSDMAINNISQQFAEYLCKNDTSGHRADGRTIQERLYQSDKIKNCSEIGDENIGHGTASDSINDNYVAFGVYSMIYLDAQVNWIHRRSLLRNNFTNNFGGNSTEGVVGIGYYKTSNWTINGTTYNRAATLLIHVIDPCSSWDYAADINKKRDLPKLQIYPNPVSAKLYISYNQKENLSLTLYSSQGKKLKSIEDFQQPFMDVSQLNPGIYFLKIRSQKGVNTKKIVIQL